MVWFQCEACGENLKKPKLANHFRCCSAYKLSCIDCGETFNQQSVQGHNQCITEAEKYGPKGQGKASNGTTPKAKNNSKQKPDIDINVGLSERYPWYCSLCNTNATSQQALLLHAEGKKHRAKARAFHAANQQSKQTEESKKDEVPSNKDVKESKEEDSTNVALENNSLEAENGNVPSNKKRKSDPSGNERASKKVGNDTSGKLGNGEMGRAEAEKKEVEGKEISAKKDPKKKIKWKKLITSALKSSPDGVLKMKKLRKLILEAIQESGITEGEVQLSDMLEQKSPDGVLKMKKLRKLVPEAIQESGITEGEVQLSDMLEKKINSFSRFTVDNKCIRLMAKN